MARHSFSVHLQVALLKGIGKLLAALPTFIPQAICIILGDLIYFAPTHLRRAVLSNLQHAFPDKPRSWRKKIAKESCRRTVEMGLFVLASPYFSRKKLRSRFILDDFYRECIEKGGPYIILVPHFSGMEAITLTSMLFDGDIPQTGVIYRPFGNLALEKYVKDTRERGGVTLLSRKEGFTRAMEMLRQGASIAVLFDQSAGNQGALTLFFDRLASTSELPGLLVQRFKCEFGVLYTERTGFWRAKMRAEKLSCGPEAHAVTLTANAWLEKKLKENDNICSDWLWLHRRWKTQWEPSVALRLQSSRNILKETLEFQHKTNLPKKTRLWIRMPNWLGDVMMALPWVRAIREARPDAEVTLLVQPSFVALLKALDVADGILPLPKKGLSYFFPFIKWRGQFCDRLLIFANSTRSDFEALLIGAEASHGVQLPGRNRFFIDYPWSIPATLALTTTHQTTLWGEWLKSMGLLVSPKIAPLNLNIQKHSPMIGLIAGSENSPEKRWSIHHWRELVGHLLQTYPKHRLVFFGTANDSPTVATIAQGFDPLRVQDLSGKTSLMAFAEGLKACDLVIGNDTGGVHLSNALGIPTLVLFGPTNPLKTAPIFSAPKVCLQPPGCPPTGGRPMVEISPATVLQSAKALLEPYTVYVKS